MSGLMLNEDNSHFFTSRQSDKMNVEGLKELIDNYASSQMTEILLCPNAMRTNFKPTNPYWQPIWSGYEPDCSDNQLLFKGAGKNDSVDKPRRWVHNAWLLDRKGIDPYSVWISYIREKHISPWISMRMNDVHEAANPDSFMHSDFWKNHPEYRRVPYRKMICWPDAALDYGRREVREYSFSLIKEYLARYDIDGLELDWMRFGFHFRPGFEEQGGKFLTEFMQQVKDFAEKISSKRGKKIKIGVRVPSRPMAAKYLGMDAVDWARRKLVDVIVITPFWATMETDMPVELWRKLIDDDDITLAGGLELNIRPFPEAGVEIYPEAGWAFKNTAETVRGTAASFLYRGVDKIYLFNYMDSETTMPNRDDYQAVLNQAGQLETAISYPRRHVITYADTHPPGQPIPRALPAKCNKNRLAEFRIHIGPKPTFGTSQVIFGLGRDGNLNINALDVWVNGFKCDLTDAPNIPIHPVVHKSAAFALPHDTLVDGYNIIEVLGQNDEAYEILWTEIRIIP